MTSENNTFKPQLNWEQDRNYLMCHNDALGDGNAINMKWQLNYARTFNNQRKNRIMQLVRLCCQGNKTRLASAQGSQVEYFGVFE
jgi:hypothetical protein